MRPDIYRCNVNAFGNKLLYIFKFIPKDVSFVFMGNFLVSKKAQTKSSAKPIV